MKKTHLLSFTAAVAIGLWAGTANAQTQWIKDKLSDQCSAESQNQIADATRKSIEESVARAEASIKAPASVADLSCMNDLMSANLDIFSSSWMNMGSFNIDSIINDITGGLKSGLSVESLSSGVERAICDFAKEKFSELTSGLTGSMNDIVSGASDLKKFTDGFGLLNMKFNSGGGSGTTGSPVVSRPRTPKTTTTTPAPTAPATGPSTGPSSTEAQIQSIWSSINGGRN